MVPIPTLDRSPSPPDTTPDAGPTRRRIRWLTLVLALVAVVAAVVAAAGLFAGRDPSPDVTIGGPADGPDIGPPAAGPGAEAPLDAEYGEELRANWDVTGVAVGDSLPVRRLPRDDAAVVATLPWDAAEFESTGRIAQVGDQRWREIIVPNDGVGWVDASYLTETS